MGRDGMHGPKVREALIAAELDDLARDLATSIERIVAEATRSIQEAARAAHVRGIALSRRLARAEVASRLDGLGLDDEGRETHGLVGLPENDTPGLSPSGGDLGKPSDAVLNQARSPGVTSREVILGAMVDAGGSMPKTAVRQRVLEAGWTESAYKKINVRLRREGAIVDDGAAWTITDDGRRQAGRIEDGSSGSTAPMQGEGEM